MRNRRNLLVQYSDLLMNSKQHCNISGSLTHLLHHELEHIIHNGQLIWSSSMTSRYSWWDYHCIILMYLSFLSFPPKIFRFEVNLWYFNSEHQVCISLPLFLCVVLCLEKCCLFQIFDVSSPVLHLPAQRTLLPSGNNRNDCCLHEEKVWTGCSSNHFQCSEGIWLNNMIGSINSKVCYSDIPCYWKECLKKKNLFWTRNQTFYKSCWNICHFK